MDSKDALSAVKGLLPRCQEVKVISKRQINPENFLYLLTDVLQVEEITNVNLFLFPFLRSVQVPNLHGFTLYAAWQRAVPSTDGKSLATSTRLQSLILAKRIYDLLVLQGSFNLEWIKKEQ